MPPPRPSLQAILRPILLPALLVATLGTAEAVETWSSHAVATQSGSPQATVTGSAGTQASLALYVSTDAGGVQQGSPFGVFTTGPHPESFNLVSGYWAGSAGSAYPYAGKSMVGRGSGAGEANAAAPLGVMDLQLHPPSSSNLTVCAFIAPIAGTYRLRDLGVRRVHNQGGGVLLRVFRPDRSALPGYIPLRATNNQDWVRDGATYDLGSLQVGGRIHVAVDYDGEFGWDATEVSWTVECDGGTTPVNTAPTISTIAEVVATVGQATPAAAVTVADAETAASALVVSATSSNQTVVPDGALALGGSGGSRTLSLTASAAGSAVITVTVSDAGGLSASRSFSVTANPVPTGGETWVSHAVTMQAGSPQARVAGSAGTGASVALYVSTDDGGVQQGALFSTFTAGTHGESFNQVSGYWADSAGVAYPYAGKSTVGRGSGAGEANAAAPLGVMDLQVHPPNNGRQVVCAFVAPVAGSYRLRDLGVRRVFNQGGSVVLRVHGPDRGRITTIPILQATLDQDWVRDGGTYTIGNLAAGERIHLAVGNADGFSFDATEITWTIELDDGQSTDQPPQVDLSATLAVTTATFTVPATVSDDSGTPTVAWSLVPASSIAPVVRLASAAAVVPQVTVPRNGVYRLQVSVSDGVNPAELRQIDVTVNDPVSSTFSGTVRDDGTVVQANPVRVRWLPDQAVVASLATASDGRFAITGLLGPAEDFELVVDPRP